MSTGRSEADNRAFEYFYQNAIVGLKGFDHNSDFWSQSVLQFANASPAVFRATLALSARHEDLYRAKAYGQAPSKLGPRSLRQYNKAIRQLCSQQADQPYHFTLTCCVLFICLENLSGNHDAALFHLSNGLKVLKEWHSHHVTSTAEKTTRDQITMVLCRLDMQATTFLDSRQPQLDLEFIDGVYRDAQPVFSSLQQAQAALERLVIRLLYVLTTNSSSEYPASSSRNEYLPARIKLLEGLRTSFARWNTAYVAFSSKESKHMEMKDLQLSCLLALHHRTTSLMLELRLKRHLTNRGLNSSLAENLDSRFVQVIDMAAALITSESPSQSSVTSSFSADMGVISVVYFVAMNAGDFHLRQRAVDILGEIEGKEGFWDPGVARTISQKALNLEMSGNFPEGKLKGGIPELSKAFDGLCLMDQPIRGG